MKNTANLAEATLGDTRWAAVVARDGSADGSFFYSVATTGVYCRPSCAARLARPENVRFHPTREDAERAGFRPCKRCKPDRDGSAHAEAIAAACRLIETAEHPPALEELARQAHLSPHHFHRVFKAATGLTPREYAAARREQRVRDALRSSDSVTGAIYDAGYHSNGRFYAASNGVLGMTPGEYRAGGARTEIHYAVGECSLGSILVARSPRGICAILLGENPKQLQHDLEDRFPRAHLVAGGADFDELVSRVVTLVEEPAQGLDLPLDIRGTAFQQRVWQALRRIPPGATASYSEIAKAIGAPKSVRAVAQACGANTLAIAVPCHRVVRGDGSLSGYRWGVDRKRALLEREARP